MHYFCIQSAISRKLWLLRQKFRDTEHEIHQTQAVSSQWYAWSAPHVPHLHADEYTLCISQVLDRLENLRPLCGCGWIGVLVVGPIYIILGICLLRWTIQWCDARKRKGHHVGGILSLCHSVCWSSIFTWIKSTRTWEPEQHSRHKSGSLENNNLTERFRDVSGPTETIQSAPDHSSTAKTVQPLTNPDGGWWYRMPNANTQSHQNVLYIVWHLSASDVHPTTNPLLWTAIKSKYRRSQTNKHTNDNKKHTER